MCGQMASACSDGSLKLWDLRTHRCIRTSYVHKQGIWALTYEPGVYDRVITGSRDRHVFFVDTKRNETFHVLQAEQPVLSVCFFFTKKNIMCLKMTSSHISKILACYYTGSKFDLGFHYSFVHFAMGLFSC